MDDATAERIGRNDALFRDANEQIGRRAVESRLSVDIPFLCECANPSCTEVIQLSVREYERIRSDPTRFLNAPGHNAAGGSAVEVVERRAGYEIVVKVGHAAEVVEDLDPRSRA